MARQALGARATRSRSEIWHDEEGTDVWTDGLQGSLPALITPLTAEGEIHEDDLATLITRALGDGASGVLVAGSTGEGALLEPEQRVQLTRCARRVIDVTDRGAAAADAPRIPPPLLAGASGATVEALDADVARLAEAGADAVLVLAPSTYPLDTDELVALHLGVAERASAPTLVYHIPQLTGSALTPDSLHDLAAHPRIVGMKDSSPDAARRATFLEVARALSGFTLFTGHAPSLRAALEAGAGGSITAIANVRQRQVVALHTAVAAGDREAAEGAQAALTRTTERLLVVGASLPATLKAALQLEGVVAERWCRPPLRSVGPGQLDRIRTALMH